VKARVLIVAREDALAGPLSDGLGRLDWRCVTARGPEAALAAMEDFAIEAVIVDVDSMGASALTLPPVLKAASAPQRLPVVALGHADLAYDVLGFDLALTPPLHPVQAALRLEALVRAALAEEEFVLRQETFAARGKTLSAQEPFERPIEVLTVGEPTPRFLALSHAMTAANMRVTSAFSAYTAFDYLHDAPFDAVILWSDDNPQEAVSIASGMRRNTRFYHTPTVLCVRNDAEINLADAYQRGLSDLVSTETPEAETVRRLASLAKAYRRESAIRRALEQARSSGLMDSATGLFTRDLFAAHLHRLGQAAEARRRPLSVAVLRMPERPEMARLRAEGWLDRATPQIGSMIGRLVRAEDTAARLAPEVFALALPATRTAARSAALRIAAVIGCTAFEAGQDRTPFTVDFDVGAAEIEPGENPALALERAAAGAFTRQAS
jgi:two-component system cell cycle response regulator PopA